MINPKVSVIVLTRNRAEFLLRSLSSISSQVFDQPVEIIVVADSCTDDTVKMLKMWEILDRGNRHIVEVEVSGIGHAANIGVSLAKGEYICRLDDDDWYSKYFMAVMVVTLDNCPEETPGVYCAYDIHTEEGKEGVDIEILACNVMWRRQAVLDAGNYNKGCKRGEDKDLLERMGMDTLCPVLTPLYRYWKHKERDRWT